MGVVLPRFACENDQILFYNTRVSSSLIFSQAMEPQIEQFLSRLPGSKRQSAARLRELILSANKEIKETIRWTTSRSGNCLTFTHEKDNVAFIYTYPTVDYISLGFFFATALQDPKQLFEGTGKGMRHIKVGSVKDIPAAQVKAWVKEAVKLLKE